MDDRRAALYAALAYPFALFSAIAYFDDYLSLGPADERRLLRRAQLLVLLAPIHVLFPLTALGILRAVTRLVEKPEVRIAVRRRLGLTALSGAVVSAVVFIAAGLAMTE